MIPIVNIPVRRLFAALGVAVATIVCAGAALGVSAELAPEFKACTEAPSPRCVFSLAADTITVERTNGGDPLLAFVEHGQIVRLARETAIGLANTGTAGRAVDLIRAVGHTAEERALILLDTAKAAPALAQSTATNLLLKESVAALDPFAEWPALASASAVARHSSLSRWLAILRLCESVGLPEPVRASASIARSALGTSDFDRLDEAGRSELAAAVVRAELIAHAPIIAEEISGKVSSGAEWTALRVEIAAEYARRNRTDLAIARTSHLSVSAKQAATAEIFKSFLRQRFFNFSRTSLLQLDAGQQAKALVEAAETARPVDLLAVLNVVPKPVRAIAESAVVRRYVREGDYKQALQLASSISEPWARLEALVVVTIHAALAGDAATTRDARYWLDATRQSEVSALEFFNAGFVSAFSRVALGDHGSSARNLQALQVRFKAVERSDMTLANPQALDLLSFNLDAFRMIAGEDQLLTAGELSTSALFGRTFAVGTAFGMSGASSNSQVASLLVAIASVEDPNLRIALLVTLGHQMQNREMLVGFDKSW